MQLQIWSTLPHVQSFYFVATSYSNQEKNEIEKEDLRPVLIEMMFMPPIANFVYEL